MKKKKTLEVFKTLAKQQELTGKGTLVVKGGTILLADLAAI